MDNPRIAPYGAWNSPLGSERLVAQALQPSDPDFASDGAVCWQELRPSERGRSVVLRRDAGGDAAVEWSPADTSARTRVHEYGGRAYLVGADGALIFSRDTDQRLLRIGRDGAARPLTPALALRYADLCEHPHGRWLVAVREDHRGGGEPVHALVRIGVDGEADEGRVIVDGSDFVAAPRISPDGRRLAWLSWNHPDMPWDGTELWIGDLDADGNVGARRRVAGSRDESVCQPQWSPDGVLHFVCDRSGWWNLYRWRDDRVEALCPMEAEFGLPMWVFGQSTYAFESAARIVCSYGVEGRSKLALLHLDGLRLETIATPFDAIGSVRAAPGRALFSAGSATQETAIVLLDLASRRFEVVRQGGSGAIEPAFVSVPESIRFPTAGGVEAHGFFYPPHHPGFRGPPGEKPPLLVLSHGGPTAAASPVLRAALQFWTTRGFAVLDVDYGGSTGFGRAYRQRLDGQWGIVDVDDCIAGARFLVERGDVDGARLLIRGGSAGGFTTLAALTFRTAFAAGASHYGIGDLEALARDTHKFESRYLERLVGPWPAAAAVYRERSPIHHLDRLACPLILLQGSEDRVVPPEQSRAMAQALRERGLPVAYLEFEGEQHGFRQAANIRRALDAELYFYGRVLGFEPADAIEPVPIDNL